MAATRNQPTYDFLAGGDPSPPRQPPHREPLKSSVTVRADVNNEALRAQLNTLQYELDSIKQERELTTLQQQSEIREANARAEADFKRAQAAEAARDAAAKKCEALSRDFQDVQAKATNEKLESGKRYKRLQEDINTKREDFEDEKGELASQLRQKEHTLNELESRHSRLQASVEGVQQDLKAKGTALQTTQHRLSQRESEVGELENEVLRLRAQSGDSETLGLIKRELSDQVAHIKKLEATNREYAAELRQFRNAQKSVEVVEEEKRALESKVRMMGDLRKELSEARLQRQILEDEKRSWTSYLESEAAGDEDMRYGTPEEMAGAFIRERLERLTLFDKLGLLQPELTVKDENIRTLEEEKAKLLTELEKATTFAASAGDSKAKARLERQKNLAVKEVEYLRAQIKNFEAEAIEFQPEHVDEAHKEQVQRLDAMLEEYRTNLARLHDEMSKLEAQPVPPLSNKRPREDDDEESEQLGQLRRKVRTLQEDLSQIQTRNHVLEADFEATSAQLTSLKESSRNRILELRSNPTADAEAVKLFTLNTLREENASLLEQLEGRPASTKVVPISTLENLRLQMQDLQDTLKKTEKKTSRLKEIWLTKSLEFREAVASILGWKLDFMPNGRVKATSIMYPTLITSDGEEEASIIFDGEKGTMKISGGVQSQFAGEIKNLIEFWVEGRKEVPCFLAACTLDFYDRTTRASRM